MCARRWYGLDFLSTWLTTEAWRDWYAMPKQGWKWGGCWPRSRTTTSAKRPWTTFVPCYGLGRRASRLVRQAGQAIDLVIIAQRAGVLILVVDILRGGTYEVDESGRLWVYAGD